MEPTSTDINFWDTIFKFVSMAIFIIGGLLSTVAYFVKRKDKLTDSDHEAIHGINNSISEMRNEMKTIQMTLSSLKSNVNYQDNQLELMASSIRDVQEALRRIELFHEKQHNEKLGLDNLFKKK